MAPIDYDDETTPLMVVTTGSTTPGIKAYTTESTTPIKSTAVKFVAAMVGMLAIVSLSNVVGGNDHSSTVALVNGNYDPVDGDAKECPNECQYKGKQLDFIRGGLYGVIMGVEQAWEEASGRKCCRDAGQNICHLNSPGNTCTCKDAADIADANGDVELANALREPCYIDTRCNPFQTMQGGCKAKPGTACNAPTTFDPTDCTEGYKCVPRTPADWDICDEN